MLSILTFCFFLCVKSVSTITSYSVGFNIALLLQVILNLLYLSQSRIACHHGPPGNQGIRPCPPRSFWSLHTESTHHHKGRPPLVGVVMSSIRPSLQYHLCHDRLCFWKLYLITSFAVFHKERKNAYSSLTAIRWSTISMWRPDLKPTKNGVVFWEKFILVVKLQRVLCLHVWKLAVAPQKSLIIILVK